MVANDLQIPDRPSDLVSQKRGIDEVDHKGLKEKSQSITRASTGQEIRRERESYENVIKGAELQSSDRVCSQAAGILERPRGAEVH